MTRQKPAADGKISVLLFLLFTLAALQTGCTSTSPAKQRNLHEPYTEKVWLLAGYYTGTQFVPLQGGEGTTARILFKSDGSMMGTTGINDFSGTWTAKNTQATAPLAFSVSISRLTKTSAPNAIAARFEQDLLRQIGATQILKQEKDSIVLLNGQNEILLRFIFRKADSVF